MGSVSGLTGFQTLHGGRLKTTFSNPDLKIYQGSVLPRNFPGLPENWISEWETFPSADGKLQLFGVLHRPEAWTGHRALIVFHGLGEHGGRYVHLPHFLGNAVDSVYCVDHRGHGRSEGLRGHVERFDLFCEDAALTIHRVQDQLMKRFGRAEIHILGHSMGGLIGLRTLFLHPRLPVSSATFVAPLLGIRLRLAGAKKAAAYALSRIWGNVHMTSEIDATAISHDKEVVEAYLSDRLVHRKGTPKLYTEIQRALGDTMKRDSGLDFPLQMLIPMQDRIADPDRALTFFRNLKHRDKQLRTYANFYHEALNEIGKEKVFEDVSSWITTHSTTSSSR